jgi:hypothetical protein
LKLEVQNVPQITLHGDGSLVAYLYDSDGDDTVTADASRVTMTGTSSSGYTYTNVVEDVPYVHAYARKGGYDTADLTGTPDKRDKFKAEPEDGLIRGSVYRRAKFFDKVTAHGEGTDYAVLKGSKSSAEFLDAEPFSATLTGPTTEYVALGFKNVLAWGYGGGDEVHLRELADNYNDEFKFVGDKRENVVYKVYKAEMKGPGYEIVARLFDKVIADASLYSNDEDVVRFYGSPEDDQLVVTLSEARMTGGVDFTVYGFRKVKTYSLHEGDFDTAELEGGVGDDVLDAFYIIDGVLDLGDGVDLWATAPEGWTMLLRAVAFDQVTARSGGGNDTANTPDDLSVLDYVLTLEGEWN